MSRNSKFVGAMLVCLLGHVPAWSQVLPPAGQEVLPTPRSQEPPGPLSRTPEALAVPGAPPTSYIPQEAHNLSPWITYQRDCCTGSYNGPPIMSEVYGITGISIPIGGQVGKQMDIGWVAGGGVRELLFNREADAAWTVDVGVTNTFNNISRPVRTTLNIIQPGAGGIPALMNIDVNLRSFNRTNLNLAFGRERYLWGGPQSNDRVWRVGWDVGGRWGTESATFFEIQHRTDVIGGVFATLHSDVEIPCHRCLLVGGLRAQCGYTWSDIMQRPSDVCDVNVMFTLGVRF